MTLAELKKLLVQLTQTYFAGATVTYAKQSFVAKPGSPLDHADHRLRQPVEKPAGQNH